MKNCKSNCILTFLLLFISPLSFSEQAKISLTVEVSGAIPGKGQAILSIFTSPDGYMKQPTISEIKPIDNDGQVVFKLDHLEPGTYAASIVYDEDSNGKLNTGIFGIPTELVGFSNNAKGTFGPPSYKKSSFILSASETINIIFGKAKE
jgi:uncharacterized protein (DUF2141 family)